MAGFDEDADSVPLLEGRREAFRFGRTPPTIVRCCAGITLAKRNPKKKLRMPLTLNKTVADPGEAFAVSVLAWARARIDETVGFST